MGGLNGQKNCKMKVFEDLERIETTRPVARVRRVGWSISHECHYASEFKSNVKTLYRYSLKGGCFDIFLGSDRPMMQGSVRRITFSIVQVI